MPFAAMWMDLEGVSGGSAVKNPPVSAGEAGSIPGSGRSPGGRNDNPLQGILPGKSRGQRSLVGYSLWGHKESDTTEQLTTHTGMDPEIVILRRQRRRNII